MKSAKHRVLLITGPPGVGKTTLVEYVYERFKAEGVRIAGFVSNEVREGNARVGFKIKDLLTGEEGWLAKTGPGVGPKIGRYTVVTSDLESIGVKAIEAVAREDVELGMVDEVGPMEMTSPAFNRALVTPLDTGKPMIVTFRQGSTYPVIRNLIGKPGVEVLEMTPGNRDSLREQVVTTVSDWLEGRS